MSGRLLGAGDTKVTRTEEVSPLVVSHPGGGYTL